MNLVNKCYIFLRSTTPARIGGFVATMDWRAAVLVVVMFALDWVVFWPFFKRYEATCLQQEQGE